MSSSTDANKRPPDGASASAPAVASTAPRPNHRRTRRTLGRWVKRIALIALAAAALGAMVMAFLPKPVSVDLAAAARAPMRVTVREDGKTQVKHRYIISSPIAGNLLRIDLEPGAPVADEQVLARIVPTIPPLLDARTRAEAGAGLNVALASQRQAAAQAEAARVAHEMAAREAQRYTRLGARNAMSQEAVDRAVYEERARAEDLASAEFAVKVAANQVAMARAALGRMQGPGGQAASTDEIALASPIAGQVLKVFQESATVVAPGQMLIEVGDTHALEVLVDVLTRDAVHIVPGAAVTIERWGGDAPLQAHVRRVEPSAFTRLSALGVEEQRVNVVIELDEPPTVWAALGDGYRVEVAITVWATDDALTVPVSAVFRHGDAWAVYVDQGGLAMLTPVEVGRRNQDRAQILSGLDAGARVVVHPSDRVTHGVELLARRK